ncbi:MAG: Pvc16 family protein [Crocosphaera sp.]|nr:Pvc16 family protein [Crocosphaera sp.]
MISDFDRTLEKLLEREFGTPLPFDLSFAMPKKEFTPISTDKNTLNCYLYDISEDRELRRVDPLLSRNPDGTVENTPAPARIRLSYCITAWSPAQTTPATEPELDEHRLLSQVLKVLLKYPVLPADVLVGTLIGQEPLLPTTVVMPSDKKSTSEFWNAVGGQLRPSLDYGVTISLVYQPAITGPMVTTGITSYQPDLHTGQADEWIQIGGYVTDNATSPHPIANAWVLLTETGQTKITDNEGRFSFGRLRQGNYTLRVRAVDYQEGGRPIQVPASSGEYNVQLIPT